MILVTGGTGFVGSHLVENLRAHGQSVRCLVRARSSLRWLPAGVETAAADLSSGRGLAEALTGVDTVIHVAGVTRALNPADFHAANVAATEILVRACAGRPLRFVHVSSIAAVGPSLDGHPLEEEAEPHPVSAYGHSKLEAEKRVRAIRPDAVIVRPPVVYGPRDTGVLQILKAVARGLVVEIAGGDRFFSAIYAEDLAEGLWAAAHRAPAGRTYFLSHSKAATWRELGSAAAAIMGRRPRTLRVPVPLAHSIGFFAEIWSRISRNPAIISREKVAEACYRFWTCSPARAAADFQFEAPTPLAAGLAKTLGWYKEAGWLVF